jgi:hypothetical protein
MKKLITVVAVVALLTAACGDAGTESADIDEAPATSLAAPDDTATTTVPDSVTATTAAEQPILREDAEAKSVPTTIPGGSSDPVEEDVSQPVSHPDPNVAIAMTDLVARFGVAADGIKVVSVEEVTWSDGSLGCPLPGMRYTQALVNGTRIVLESDGRSYQYHSGPNREPFYCANPADPVGGEYGDL